MMGPTTGATKGTSSGTTTVVTTGEMTGGMIDTTVDVTIDVMIGITATAGREAEVATGAAGAKTEVDTRATTSGGVQHPLALLLGASSGTLLGARSRLGLALVQHSTRPRAAPPRRRRRQLRRRPRGRRGGRPRSRPRRRSWPRAWTVRRPRGRRPRRWRRQPPTPSAAAHSPSRGWRASCGARRARPEAAPPHRAVSGLGRRSPPIGEEGRGRTTRTDTGPRGTGLVDD